MKTTQAEQKGQQLLHVTHPYLQIREVYVMLLNTDVMELLDQSPELRCCTLCSAIPGAPPHLSRLTESSSPNPQWTYRQLWINHTVLGKLNH